MWEILFWSLVVLFWGGVLCSLVNTLMWLMKQ